MKLYSQDQSWAGGICVIANSEEEAIKMVENGDVDSIDYEVEGEDPAREGECWVYTEQDITE